MRAAHETPADRGEPQRWRVAAGLEWALWGIGLALLTVAVVWMGEAAWYQRRAAALLRAGGAAATPPASTAAPAVASGTPLGRLLIPRLGLDVVVAEGVGSGVLRRAVGRVPESAAFDERGNVVLAGHRDTFFRPLEEIRIGDRIVLDRPAGRAEYRVEWVEVVEPSRVEVTGATGYPALTLLTCYPFRYLGAAPYRLVVRARLTAGGGASRG